MEPQPVPPEFQNVSILKGDLRHGGSIYQSMSAWSCNKSSPGGRENDGSVLLEYRVEAREKQDSRHSQPSSNERKKMLGDAVLALCDRSGGRECGDASRGRQHEGKQWMRRAICFHVAAVMGPAGQQVEQKSLSNQIDAKNNDPPDIYLPPIARNCRSRYGAPSR